mgnify:CR=1 FL=1
MDLRDIINSIYPISEKSMDRLLSCSLELGLPKGHRLLEAGKIESDIFFIKRGIVRAYISHEGKDITFWIGKEGATIMSLKSYVKNEAGYETIELMEDSLLYRLFEEDIDIANWGRKLAELEFLRAEEKLIPLLFTTASERYRVLLERTPDLLQRIPLECLASYLGITPVSLSRIRAKLK